MAQMLLLNPRRRRKARKTATKRRKTASNARKPNPIRHRRRVHRKIRRVSTRRYRRNPMRGKASGIMGMLGTAAIGAAGGIGLDVMMGYLPLPATVKTGMVKYATKGTLAVALTLVLGSVMSKATAGKVGNGMLTVVLHDAMREQLGTSMPTLSLGDSAIPYYPDAMPAPEQLGYASPGMPTTYGTGMGEYIEPGMGEYVTY